MDAVKILGSLLANNAMGSSAGGNILGTLLGGSGHGGGGGKAALAASILGALMGGGRRSGGNGGLGALGGLLGAASGRGGGAMDVLGSLLGGGAARGGSGLGAIEGLLGGGGAPRGGAAGGLGDMLGGILGAAGGASSGVGHGGGAGSGSQLLGALLGAAPGPMNEPPQDAHDEAQLLIEAMCNAAKVDGSVDSAEQEEIIGKMGDLDAGEVAFLKEQLSSPLDLEGFLARVPDDMDEQVYAFSLMAVKLDSQAEAEYFAKLAGGLGLTADQANHIHAQMGEPEIFRS